MYHRRGNCAEEGQQGVGSLPAEPLAEQRRLLTCPVLNKVMRQEGARKGALMCRYWIPVLFRQHRAGFPAL